MNCLSLDWWESPVVPTDWWLNAFSSAIWPRSVWRQAITAEAGKQKQKRAEEDICANRNCSAGLQVLYFFGNKCQTFVEWQNIGRVIEVKMNLNMMKIDEWEILNLYCKKKTCKILILKLKYLKHCFLLDFFPFTHYFKSLRSSPVAQCHIDFMIAKAVLSFFLSYNPLFTWLVFLLVAMGANLWRNFSHLRVIHLLSLVLCAHFTVGRERPSWRFIPCSLGRGKRLSLAFTRYQC